MRKIAYIICLAFLAGCYERENISDPYIELPPKLRSYEGEIWQAVAVTNGKVDFKVEFNGKPANIWGENYYLTCFGPGLAPILMNAAFEEGEPELPFIISWRNFGSITRIEYNNATKTIDFEYDDKGFLIKKTSNDEVITFTHNGEGRIRSKHFSARNITYKYLYDSVEANFYDSLSHVTKIVNESNNEIIIEYIYNKRGTMSEYGKAPQLKEIIYFNGFYMLLDERLWQDISRIPIKSEYKGVVTEYIYADVYKDGGEEIQEIRRNHKGVLSSTFFYYKRIK